jgi:uncharacterized membrane protein
MEWQIIVVLAVVVPLILFPVAFIWYVNIGGLTIMLRERRSKKAAAKERMGEIAEEQAVVKVATAQERGERRMRVLTPAGKRAQWAIGLTLGLPVIIALLPLFPVAFIWYINASGLYQVLRDTRQRQKQRAEAVRAAEGIARTKITAVKDRKTEEGVAAPAAQQT